MKLLSTATYLYHRVLRRIDATPGKMTLSKAFETKRHHPRITETTELKLASIFNSTLFEKAACVSTPTRIAETERQLVLAVECASRMSPSKGQSALLLLATSMNERLLQAKADLRAAVPALLPHQGTLADAIRPYLAAGHHDPSMEACIHAFAETRYGLADDLTNTQDPRAWSRLRRSNDCVSLAAADQEVDAALCELDSYRNAPAYAAVCLVLDELKTRVELATQYWREVLGRAAQRGVPSDHAALAASWLGPQSAKVQLTRCHLPGLFRVPSSDGGESDTSSGWH